MAEARPNIGVPATPKPEVPLRSRVSVDAGLTFGPVMLALLLWIVSIPAIDPDRMTDLGLMAALPVAFFVALAVLIAGFFLTQIRIHRFEWAPAAYIAAWIVIVHGTPAIVYGSLRYAWAWKHVGIVDYIQRTNRVDPAIAFMPVYHNWPGFFGAAALLTESAGLDDALGLATWAPVFFELLFAAGVLLILRGATANSRLAWLGVWFFALTNWVGQDYFAPQAMAYALYLIAIGICLWAFATRVSLSATAVGRVLGQWTPLMRLLTVLDRRVEAAQAGGTALVSVSLKQRRGLLAMTIVLLAAIAVSHQLTPIVTIMALAALAIFGQCSARGLPLIMLLFTAGWLVTGASEYAAFGIREIVDSFGRANENFSANLIDASQFSPGFGVISNMARGLTAAVGLLAVAGWTRRFRQGYLDVPLTLLWIVPMGLLAVSNYGGEILFRVFFFALPFMAFYVAALFVSGERTMGTLRAVASATVSGLLAIAFLFAYYGHEQSNYFRPGEVAAAEYLMENAPPGALFVEVSPNYPSRFARYEEFTYVPLIVWPRGSIEASTNTYTPQDILDMMTGPTYSATYLIFTDSQLLDLSRPGLASVEELRQNIDSSGRYRVVYQNANATIYMLAVDQPGNGA